MIRCCHQADPVPVTYSIDSENKLGTTEYRIFVAYNRHQSWITLSREYINNHKDAVCLREPKLTSGMRSLQQARTQDSEHHRNYSCSYVLLSILVLSPSPLQIHLSLSQDPTLAPNLGSIPTADLNEANQSLFQNLRAKIKHVHVTHKLWVI